ncbi:hypothetical protein BKI52_37135 [marine bacterium AO1-C]|nr:hypothetical protein BKI52_37135 [marine bacterium AO1-C]
MWEPEELKPKPLAAKIYPLVEARDFAQIKSELLKLMFYFFVPNRAASILNSPDWQKIEVMLLHPEKANRLLATQLIDSQFSVNVGRTFHKILNSNKFDYLHRLLQQLEDVMYMDTITAEHLKKVEADINQVRLDLETTNDPKEIRQLNQQLERLLDEERYINYQIKSTDDPVYDNAMMVALAMLSVLDNLLEKTGY